MQNQEQEMLESISNMEKSLKEFREFSVEITQMHSRWAERVERIDQIEKEGWRYQSNLVLPETNQKVLANLRKTAQERMLRDEERVAESQSVLEQMTSRLDELRKVSKDFRLYVTMNALESSSEMSGKFGDEVISLMQDSRKLTAQASAYIEIEAGKSV